jgi:hypothetical protein
MSLAFIAPYIRQMCPRNVADAFQGIHTHTQHETTNAPRTDDTADTDTDDAAADRAIRGSDADVAQLFDAQLEHPKHARARAATFAQDADTDADADAVGSNSNSNDRSIGSVHGMTKEALIIGINYTGQRAALAGCINDAHSMRDYLSECCELDSYLLMTDRTRVQPRKAYIVKAIRYMISRTGAHGGTFFMHYSGHGSQQRNRHRAGDDDYEADGLDETLVPIDYERAGQITDDELHAMIVEELAKTTKRVRCILVLDCCHAGDGGDLAHSYGVVKGAIKHRVVRQSSKNANVIMVSGCSSAQTSADVRKNGTAFGALSNALIGVMRQHSNGRNLTWGQLLLRVNQRLAGYSQTPQLSSEQPLDLDSQIDW